MESVRRKDSHCLHLMQAVLVSAISKLTALHSLGEILRETEQVTLRVVFITL